jgi:uncharacterized protein YecE (DUF72 family)
MSPSHGQFRIGTSGYQYDHWKGCFYPEDLPKRDWLEFYAAEFDTVEINNTFYNLPSEKTFHDWADRVPRGFLFVLKFSRYGTHMKKLKAPEDSIGHFMERARLLGRTLGPILAQIPPNWGRNTERLDAFLDATPSDQRWALEVRDEDWLCEEVYEVLRKHNTALCIHDLIQDHPRMVTADWIYLRFHGNQYAGSYTHQALTAAAQRIKDDLAKGLDVYAYFNNDAEGNAVFNARDLRRYVCRDGRSENS